MSLPIEKISDVEQAESKNSKLTHGSLFQKNKNLVVTKIKVNPLSASVALI